MEIGKTYSIIYDDKGTYPVRKKGLVTAIRGNLVELNSGEILNANLIIRATPIIVEGGKNGATRTD